MSRTHATDLVSGRLNGGTPVTGRIITRWPWGPGAWNPDNSPGSGASGLVTVVTPSEARRFVKTTDATASGSW